MGHYFSKHRSREPNPLSLLLSPETAYELDLGALRLQTRTSKDGGDTPVLVIQTYAPAPPARRVWFAPADLPVKDVSTLALECFRGMNNPQPRPHVEAFLLSYYAFEEEHQVTDALIFHFRPAADSVRDMVPDLQEWLLEAMASVSETVYAAPGREGVVQTASRVEVRWENESEGNDDAEITGAEGPTPAPAGSAPDPSPNSPATSHTLSHVTGDEFSPSAIEDVADQMIYDLDISESTMARIVTTSVAVLHGAAVYESYEPFGLVHLSTLCARILCSIRQHIKDPEMRTSLLDLLFDALALGLSVRTPGLAALWVDANLRDITNRNTHAAAEPVLAQMVGQFAAVDLCLLRLTTANMQTALPGPNPAILHRLASIQDITPHLPLPKKKAERAVQLSIQPAPLGPDAADSLTGVWSLTQHAYDRGVVAALSRCVVLVSTECKGKEERMDEFHPAPDADGV